MTAAQYAAAYLQAKGWTYSGDIEKLAGLIENCCQEFLDDLENEYEKECEHGKR